MFLKNKFRLLQKNFVALIRYSDANVPHCLFWILLMAIAFAFSKSAVPMADDPLLINNAINNIKMSADWSPFFLVTLRLFYSLIGVGFYHWYVFLLGFLFSLFFYLGIKIKVASPTLSMVLTLLFIFSPFSIFFVNDGNPPSSIAMYLAVLFWMVGDQLYNARLPAIPRVFLLMFFLMLASFSRPEFFYVFIFYVVRVLLMCSKSVKKGGLFGLLAFMIVGLPVYYYVGLPVADSSRIVFAYSQHFALRFCLVYTNYCKDINPWVNWQEITGYAYLHSETLFSMLSTNLAATLGHIFYNLIETTVLILSFGYLLPLFSDNLVIKSVMLAVPVCLISLVVLGNCSKLLNRHIGFNLLLAAPFLIYCSLLFPRIHYIVFPALLFVFFIANILSSTIFRENPLNVQ